MSDDDPSTEQQPKRPRLGSLPSSPLVTNDSDADTDTDTDTDSTGSSSSAFHALLQAETAAGNTVKNAVSLLFESISTDQRGTHTDFAAPVLAALASSPKLADDLRTVARICESVYQLAKDILTPGRERLDLKLGNLEDVAHILENANNIVVLTGAGVSVSCGIPDFRSKGGLYDTIAERYNLVDPQAIFDLEEFRMDPRMFYSFAKEVMPSKDLSPSPTHRFVAELERRGKLLRNYSQNIDGLEQRAGVSEDKVVLCHGSFLTATCMRKTCRAKVSGSEIAPQVAVGTVPTCRKCASSREDRENGEKEGEDEKEDEDMDAEVMGVLKPDIVFFGESLPKSVADNLENDIERSDLLLVLGTSLKVAPIARIPQCFRESVPRILVNRELVNYGFDVELLGDCDLVVQELRNVLKWHDSVKMREESKKGMTQKAVRGDHMEKEAANADTVCSDRNDSGKRCDRVAVTFKPPRRFLFPGAFDKPNSDDEIDDMSGSASKDVKVIVENGSSSKVTEGQSRLPKGGR